MKSILTSVIVVTLLLLSINLNAQYSLQTAKYSTFTVTNGILSPNDSLPPVTSVLPAGPYYGNMNITQRPLWYYYPSCVSVSSSRLGFIIYNFSSLVNLSLAIWGPFESISGITLAQLDSTKLLGSYNKSVYMPTMPHYTPNLPHIDTGQVYIIVTTCDDTTSNQKMSPCIDLTPTHPYGANSAYTNVCNLCDGKASYFEEYKGICSLNVDTPGNYPHLVWNKNGADLGIYGYYVSRKNVFGIFDTLTFLPYTSSLSEFIDTTVNAVQQKRTYKITPVDSCNQESNTINYYSYSTIYLQSYPGLNNEVNLTWDYSGYIFYSLPVTPVSYIWRSSNGNPPVLIDSVGFGNQPFISYYTDVNAPAGPTIYSIEVRNPNACSAMKIPGSYTSMLSNISGVMVLGVDDVDDLSYINVHPNPITNNEISVDFGNPLRADAVLTLYSVDGKKTDHVTVSKGTSRFSWHLKYLSPGIYQLAFESNGYRKYIKLVSY